jgi:hypothetical protein
MITGPGQDRDALRSEDVNPAGTFRCVRDHRVLRVTEVNHDE